MSQTHPRVLDLSRSTVGLFRNGRSDVEDNRPGFGNRFEVTSEWLVRPL